MKQVKIIACSFLLLLLVLSPAHGMKKILLVHSYHSDNSWAKDITKGLKKGLTGTGILLKIHYMDTKRNPGEKNRILAGEKARIAMDEFLPDIVITADDNAQMYFAKALTGKSSPQIVFCGVNAKGREYGYPASNVTGVLERPHFGQSFDMLRVIVPTARSVAVLSDDSPTSDKLINYMKTRVLSVAVSAIYQPKTFDQWKKKIKWCQENVDAICIIVYHTIKKYSDSNETVSPGEVMDWTVQNNKKPIFTVAPFCVEDGAIFGVINSGFEQGMEAARITREILEGKKAGDIPIVASHKGAVYINIKTAEKYNFEIPFHIIRATDRIFE